MKFTCFPGVVLACFLLEAGCASKPGTLGMSSAGTYGYRADTVERQKRVVDRFDRVATILESAGFHADSTVSSDPKRRVYVKGGARFEIGLIASSDGRPNEISLQIDSRSPLPSEQASVERIRDSVVAALAIDRSLD